MRLPPFAALVLGSALLAAASARAQVLEIGDGGAVTVLAGPAMTTREGVTPLTAVAAPGEAGGEVGREIASAAARYGVEARLLRAVAGQESGLRQGARSPKGAVGVMQLMPATARALGVDAAGLAGNVQGGAAYLSQMLRRFGGDVRLALAAYNAGPGAVERHGGLPPFAETQAYVRGVLARVAASAQGPVLAVAPSAPPFGARP